MKSIAISRAIAVVHVAVVAVNVTEEAVRIGA